HDASLAQLRRTPRGRRKKWWCACFIQGACDGTDMALYWATVHRSTGGSRRSSSQQFSASPIIPCKNQPAGGPMLVVLPERLGTWRELDASPPPVINLEKANEHEPDRCRRYVSRR